MNILKLTKVISIINGSIMIGMGLFHMYATTMVYPGMIDEVGPEKGLQSAYFFAVMGLALVFAGITIVYSAKKLELSFAKNLILIQILFVIIATVAAAFCGMGHILTIILIVASCVNMLLLFIPKSLFS